MSEELQVAVVDVPDVVAVPQPDIQVLTEVQVTPVVIESPDVEVVTIGEDVTVVDTVHEFSIVTVGEAGPRGTPGDVPVGGTTGDIIRYNSVSGLWEVASEPFALKGLVLTPALASLVNAEGAMYYNSADKAVKVCTDI